ncbi:MAG TPA: hypothetical protein VKT74_08550, partial [Gammaproteobacteria bacterium]|nr:hypothetical protein [Gammaproteobacteria bacterium]
GGDPEDKTRVLLNYSVPLFVTPATDGDQQLTWTLLKADSSTLLLKVTNNGIVHAKIQIHSVMRDKKPISSVISDSALAAELRDNPLTYLLPGASRELKLAAIPGVSQGDRLQLSLDLDATREDLPLTVQ